MVGASAERVKGPMTDRKLKGKGKSSGVMCNASLSLWSGDSDTDGEATPEGAGQQNNWVRRIAGVKSVARRMMDEAREIDTRTSLIEGSVNSRLRWTGHLVQMEEKRMVKKAEGLRGTR